MILDTPIYQILPGLIYWAVVLVGATIIAMFLGLLMSLSYYGKRDPTILSGQSPPESVT